MSLSIAKSILSGIPRRGGHQTEWQHAFAVASVAVGLASAYGLSIEEVDRIQQIAFFHDIMEVAPEEGKKVITLLDNIGGVYEDLLININMLSHFEDENSIEAFERVMIVGTRDQTIVKMADCFINSQYTDEEKHWHWETFHTNWGEESAKYIRRYQVLFNELYKRLGGDMTYGIHKYWVMNNGSVIHDDFAHEGVVESDDSTWTNTAYMVDVDKLPPELTHADDDVLEPFILDYHYKKIDKPDWIVG